MARLFRYLMMAAKGGTRYLRSIMRFVIGFQAKAEMAPGSAMEAKQEVIMPDITATATDMPSSDMLFRVDVKPAALIANIVAWMVSDSVLRGLLETIPFGASAISAPGADMQGIFSAETEMEAEAETAPGSTAELDGLFSFPVLAAEAAADPPSGMISDLDIALPDLTASPAPGTAVHAAAAMEACPELASDVEAGSPAESQVQAEAGTVHLAAKVITWLAPTETGTNLYIPQVYAVEEDGTNLIIK